MKVMRFYYHFEWFCTYFEGFSIILKGFRWIWDGRAHKMEDFQKKIKNEKKKRIEKIQKKYVICLIFGEKLEWKKYCLDFVDFVHAIALNIELCKACIEIAFGNNTVILNNILVQNCHHFSHSQVFKTRFHHKQKHLRQLMLKSTRWHFQILTRRIKRRPKSCRSRS